MGIMPFSSEPFISSTLPECPPWCPGGHGAVDNGASPEGIQHFVTHGSCIACHDSDLRRSGHAEGRRCGPRPRLSDLTGWGDNHPPAALPPRPPDPTTSRRRSHGYGSGSLPSRRL
jgi:hypothetical protein